MWTSLLAAAAVLASGAAAAPAVPSPVVVELFTSQSCSDCPAADEVLSTWGMKEFRAGRVIPLSFNVDYWNQLGWRDLFSTPENSARERRYDEALRVGTYTPQMVVAGRAAFVGSDGEKAAEEARRLAEAPRTRVAVSPDLTVTVRPRDASRDGWRVMLAVFENGTTTKVPTGENAGKELRADFVVRRLVDLGAISGASPFTRKAQRRLEPSWNAKNVGAAVFLQDPKTMAVAEAGSVFPLR